MDLVALSEGCCMSDIWEVLHGYYIQLVHLAYRSFCPFLSIHSHPTFQIKPLQQSDVVCTMLLS